MLEKLAIAVVAGLALQLRTFFGRCPHPDEPDPSQEALGRRTGSSAPVRGSQVLPWDHARLGRTHDGTTGDHSPEDASPGERGRGLNRKAVVAPPTPGT